MSIVTIFLPALSACGIYEYEISLLFFSLRRYYNFCHSSGVLRVSIAGSSYGVRLIWSILFFEEYNLNLKAIQGGTDSKYVVRKEVLIFKTSKSESKDNRYEKQLVTNIKYQQAETING